MGARAEGEATSFVSAGAKTRVNFISVKESSERTQSTKRNYSKFLAAFASLAFRYRYTVSCTARLSAIVDAQILGYCWS